MDVIDGDRFHRPHSSNTCEQCVVVSLCLSHRDRDDSLGSIRLFEDFDGRRREVLFNRCRDLIRKGHVFRNRVNTKLFHRY